MALPAQVRHIPAGSGIDEATRPELLEPGAVSLVLENVRADDRGGYTKRLGVTQLASARLDGTTRTAGRKVFSAGDRLCSIDGAVLDVYSETLGTWTSVGRVPEATARVLDAPSVAVPSARVCDVAVCNGAIVFAQTDNASVVVSVTDAGGTVLRGADVFASAPLASLATYGNIVAMVYVTAASANVNLSYLDCTSAATISAGWSTPTAISTDKTLAGPTDSALALATQSLDDRIAVAYINNSAGVTQVTVKTWDTSGVLQTLLVDTAGLLPTVVALAGSTADTLWIGWNQNLQIRVRGVLASTLSTTTATSTNVLTLVTLGPSWLRLGAGHATGRGRVFVQQFASFLTRGFQTTAGATATDGAASTYLATVLWTRPMLRGVRYYAGIVPLYDLTVTTGAVDLILCDVTSPSSTLRPVALIEPGLVVPSDGYSIPSIVATGADTFVTGIQLQRSSTVNAARLVEYNFAGTDRWQSVEHNGATYLAGGVLTKFDGTRISEVPFLARPYTPDVVKNAGAGLAPAVGYRWVAVFETADGDGNWIVSSVSLPSALSATGAAASFTVNSQPLVVTTRYDAFSASAGVRVAFYRTLDGGNVYYFVEAVASNTASLPTITDSTTDTVLATRARLYGTGSLPGTNGAAQDKRPPPGFSCLASYNDMLVGAAGSSVWFSGQTVVGEGPWFSPLFRFELVDGAGDITALAAQDGTLFVFKRDRIFAVAGEAPSDNGQSGGFGAPRRLACDVGCIDPRSVLVTSLGVFFQSARGIEILTRAQSVEWIGEAVQDTLGSRAVTAATLDNAAGLARFEAATSTAGVVDAAGVCLVYDLTLKLWISVDKIAGALASASAQSACMAYVGGTWRYARIDRDGAVYLEKLDTDATAHLDEAGWITMVWETPSFKIGLQQEQRLWSAMLLFARESACGLQVQVAYDYDTTFEAARTWTEADVLAGERQLEFRPKPRGQAQRYRFIDTAPAVLGSGKGCTWIGISTNTAPKQGSTTGTPRLDPALRK